MYFQEFFLNVKDAVRGIDEETDNTTFSKWSSLELELNKKFIHVKEQVHAALCGNILRFSVTKQIRANNYYLLVRYII